MAITIISDKVNRAGFRVNVAGIKLDNYTKNPILLFMHNRAGNEWSGRTKEEERLPVGKLVNLRVEKGALVADDPIWDEKDSFAMTLKSKFEGGFMSAFSAGLIPITVSDAPEWVLQGQTRSTIVESEMIEVSFVDIPKDGLAVRLSMAEGASMDDLVPLIKNSQQPNLNLNMDLKKIALKLGLMAEASEEQIVAALDKMNAQLADSRKARTATLLALGRQKGVVTDANAKQWERTIELDHDNAEALLSNFALPETKEAAPAEKVLTVQDVLKLAHGASASSAEDRSKWTFLQWSQKDPDGLNRMRKERPSEYEKLAAAYDVVPS